MVRPNVSGIVDSKIGVKVLVQRPFCIRIVSRRVLELQNRYFTNTNMGRQNKVPLYISSLLYYIYHHESIRCPRDVYCVYSYSIFVREHKPHAMSSPLQFVYLKRQSVSTRV